MTPTQALIGLAVALSIALGGAGLLLKRSYAKNGQQAEQITALNGAVKRASEQRKLDQATLGRLAQKNAAAARESALLSQQLQRSLFENREWADQPVPQGVQDALK